MGKKCPFLPTVTLSCKKNHIDQKYLSKLLEIFNQQNTHVFSKKVIFYREVFKMNRYSSVSIPVSPKNPISREKLKITSTQIHISFKKRKEIWVIWSKTNWSYMFLDGFPWQISSNWFFQKKCGFLFWNNWTLFKKKHLIFYR